MPSFLYGMPLGNGRVFLEETCLVSKPGLPFATLKRRLERRLDAMNIKANPPAALNNPCLWKENKQFPAIADGPAFNEWSCKLPPCCPQEINQSIQKEHLVFIGHRWN